MVYIITCESYFSSFQGFQGAYARLEHPGSTMTSVTETPKKKLSKEEEAFGAQEEQEPYQLSISGVQFVFDSTSHYLRR